MKQYLLIGISVFIAACGSASPVYEDQIASKVSSPEYLSESLFSSDRSSVSNEEAQRILNSRIVLAKENKIVLFEIYSTQSTRRYYGYSYLRDENYFELENSYFESLRKKILQSKRVSEIALLPAFMRPEKPNITNLREAALRMQGNLIVVFRVRSDIFAKTRILQADEIKAFCTVEAFMIDSRTGLIPYSSIISKRYSVKHKPMEENIWEVKRDAEIQCTVSALETLGDEIRSFLDGIDSNK